MVAPFLPHEEKVAAIRNELPATGAGIYLDAASAGPLPAVTDRAMREWAEWELRVGRAGAAAEDEFRSRLDEARGTLAAILVAPPDRITLAPGPASALRLAAEARRWRAGERIVAARSLDEPILVALRGLAGATGAELVIREAAPGEDPTVPVRRMLREAERGAALFVVPHVSPVDGSVLPAEELARLARAAHRQGAWLAVDGSLAAGAIPVDLTALEVDVYVGAGDRWLLGPSGVAAAYVGRGAGDGVGSPGGSVATSLAGELHRAAVVGLGRSAGWLAMQVGLDWAFGRTRLLARRAADLLGAIPGLSLLAPAERLSGIVAFRLAGWRAERLREELGRRVFAVVGSIESGDAIRVSVGCWNTEEELGRLAGAVAELAATDPERVGRRRPPIVVVSADRP